MANFEKKIIEAAQNYRQFWEENPVAAVATGFIPVLGQTLGALDAIAAAVDPEASKAEVGLATAGILPWGRAVGKGGGAVKKLIGGPLATTHNKEQAGEALRIAMRTGKTSNDRLMTAAEKTEMARQTGGTWLEPSYGRQAQALAGARIPAHEISDEGFDSFHNKRWKAHRSGGTKYRDTLENVIQHPELFKAYPRLRNYKVIVDADLPSSGAYNSKTKEIFIHPDANPRTMIHELQHAIADIEGFGPGYGKYRHVRNSVFKDEFKRLKASGFPEAEAEKMADQNANFAALKLWDADYGERLAEAPAIKWAQKMDIPVTRVGKQKHGYGLLDEVGNEKYPVNMDATDELNMQSRLFEGTVYSPKAGNK